MKLPAMTLWVICRHPMMVSVHAIPIEYDYERTLVASIDAGKGQEIRTVLDKCGKNPDCRPQDIVNTPLLDEHHHDGKNDFT